MDSIVKEDNSNFHYIDELVNKISKELQEWNAELIIPVELWEEPTEWIIRILKQKDCDKPNNLCLFGNTDSGKSTFLLHIVPSLIRKFNLSENGIIQVTCLTNTTLKGLYQSILDKLDWRYPRQASIQELEPLVGRAVIKRNCKLIIIDEFSQLEDKTDDKRQSEVLKALRNIPKQTLRPLMIVGVKKILKLLEKDPETNNRFFKVEFRRFELTSSKIECLRKTIKALDDQLLKTTGIKSNFADDYCAIYKLFIFSKGKTGSLIKLYEWTVQFALSKKINVLKNDLIDDANTLLENNQILDDEDGTEVIIPPEWENCC